MPGKLPKAKWLKDHPSIRGVFVGGCVGRGVGYRTRSTAHAHIHGEHQGWICFSSDKWLHLREIWLHELAHLVTREWHTNRWRKFLLQIGGTLDPVVENGVVVLRSYHPKKKQHGADPQRTGV